MILPRYYRYQFGKNITTDQISEGRQKVSRGDTPPIAALPPMSVFLQALFSPTH
jgi:hypothetical protein